MRETESVKRERDAALARLDLRARNQAASQEFSNLIPQWRALTKRCAGGEQVEQKGEVLFQKSVEAVRRHLGEPAVQRFISAPYPFMTVREDFCKAYTGLVAKETALNKFIEELALRSP
jgi:hypothetical protein